MGLALKMNKKSYLSSYFSQFYLLFFTQIFTLLKTTRAETLSGQAFPRTEEYGESARVC